MSVRVWDAGYERNDELINPNHHSSLMYLHFLLLNRLAKLLPQCHGNSEFTSPDGHLLSKDHSFGV
jgi:hypothetical protein